MGEEDLSRIYATSPPQIELPSRERAKRPASRADPVRRRGRGSRRGGPCAVTPDRGLRAAVRGDRHRRARRDGTPAAAGRRGRIPGAAEVHAVDIYGRVLAAGACRADSLGGATAALPVWLASPGARDRLARPRRGRLHLSGCDGRACAPAAHRRGAVSGGGDDHRPDRPVLLGAAGYRHAPRDVRGVDEPGRADRRPRQRAAGEPADLKRVSEAALPGAVPPRAWSAG